MCSVLSNEQRWQPPRGDHRRTNNSLLLVRLWWRPRHLPEAGVSGSIKTLWRLGCRLWLSASVHNCEVLLVICVNLVELWNSKIVSVLVSVIMDYTMRIHCRFSISHRIIITKVCHIDAGNVCCLQL